jgi:uncharacterized damage-inducible protein DinB
VPAASPEPVPATALAQRLDALAASRRALLDALEGLEQDALARRPPPSSDADDGDDARWSIREVLWHVGDAEQMWGAWAEATLRGDSVPHFHRARRPAERNRLPQLLAWLEESRAATLARCSALDDAALSARRPTPDGERSILEVLDHLASHEREHVAQIAALRALPPSEAR